MRSLRTWSIPRYLRLAGLLGCLAMAGLLWAPVQAPATRQGLLPLPVFFEAPQSGPVQAPIRPNPRLRLHAPTDPVIVPVPDAPPTVLPPVLLPVPDLPRRVPPLRLVRPPVPVPVPAEGTHRLRLPPPLPPRVHRLHPILPVLAMYPYFVAPRVGSDHAPVARRTPQGDRPLGLPQLLTPGALPDGFRYHYDDDYLGWPVAPLHEPHAIHGALNDPRAGGYHFGIDITVDDSRPAAEAPQGLSHRIYAVEGGVLRYGRPDELAQNCNDRRFEIGHFAYWHASPALPNGTRVSAGQTIGWTCLNEWHVHLSEWALVGGQRQWVNPLHAGGKLRPYVDTAKPIIRAIYAYTPPGEWWKPTLGDELADPDGAVTLTLGDLRNAVDLRAWIDDSQGDLDIYENPRQRAATISPYRVWIQIRRVADDAIVWQRDVWRSDLLLVGREPFFAHYAARTRPSLSDFACVNGADIVCNGRLFFHLVVSDDNYLWDTRSVPNGDYVLTVRAFDVAGNFAERSEPMTVTNGDHGSYLQEK